MCSSEARRENYAGDPQQPAEVAWLLSSARWCWEPRVYTLGVWVPQGVPIRAPGASHRSTATPTTATPTRTLVYCSRCRNPSQPTGSLSSVCWGRSLPQPDNTAPYDSSIQGCIRLQPLTMTSTRRCGLWREHRRHSCRRQPLLPLQRRLAVAAARSHSPVEPSSLSSSPSPSWRPGPANCATIAVNLVKIFSRL